VSACGIKFRNIRITFLENFSIFVTFNSGLFQLCQRRGLRRRNPTTRQRRQSNFICGRAWKRSRRNSIWKFAHIWL